MEQLHNVETFQVDCLFDDVRKVLPLANSELFKESTILNASKLTFGCDVKDVYCIELPSYVSI